MWTILSRTCYVSFAGRCQTTLHTAWTICHVTSNVQWLQQHLRECFAESTYWLMSEGNSCLRICGDYFLTVSFATKKFVNMFHWNTPRVFIFQCNSTDKYSKNLITKEMSSSFHGDRTQWSLLRQTAASGELKNSMFQRPTSSPSLGWCGNCIILMMEMELVSEKLDFIIHRCSCLAKKTSLTTELSSNVIITTDPYWKFDSHCPVLLFISVTVTFIPLYKTWTFMVVKIYSQPSPTANLTNADLIIHMTINMWVNQKISKQVF